MASGFGQWQVSRLHPGNLVLLSPRFVSQSSVGCGTCAPENAIYPMRPAAGSMWRPSDVHTPRVHLDLSSPFRPCGRDLVEFFNSTGWALELTRWRGGRYRVRRTQHCWSR